VNDRLYALVRQDTNDLERIAAVSRPQLCRISGCTSAQQPARMIHR
jgi:hypothetical protein